MIIKRAFLISIIHVVIVGRFLSILTFIRSLRGWLCWLVVVILFCVVLRMLLSFAIVVYWLGLFKSVFIILLRSIFNLYNFLSKHVIIMGRILSLFDDAVWSSLVVNHSEQASAPAVTQVPAAPRGCCSGCELAGLCDSDECAAKLYPIDAPFAFTLFPNLGAYVQFLKSHGWL